MAKAKAKVEKATKVEKHVVAEYNDTYIKPGSGVARNHCAIAEPLKGGKALIPSMEKINKKKKDFSAISFFAGCGGASIGMKAAGFNVLYANEFVPSAQDTYRLNHPKTLLDGSDIRTIDPRKIMKKLKLEVGELDYLDASPPCKGFSTAGIQEEGWGKEVEYSDGIYQRVDDLFDEGVRMIKAFKPKAFQLENVAGLVKGASKGFFVEIMDDLEKAGYVVKAAMINPIYLGLPQTRERMIFLGVRKDIVKKHKLVPCFPPIKNKIVTVRDVLPHIVKIKTKVKDFLAYVDSDIPSPTIVASDFDTGENASFSCGGWCEDNKGRRRKYTLHELRRLMAVPDDFKLTGVPRQQWERLGRIHSPLQVYHLAKTMRAKVLEPYYDANDAEYTDKIK